MIVLGGIILFLISVWLGMYTTSKIGFPNKKEEKSPNQLAIDFLKAGKIEELEELRALIESPIVLEEQDLSNLNLARAVLNGITFKSVNFNNSDLSYADLRNSIFERCDLSNSKLINIQWNNSILEGNNFTKSQIDKTDFSNSILNGNNFSESNQNEIILSSTIEQNNIDLITNTKSESHKNISIENSEIDDLIKTIQKHPSLLYDVNPNKLEEIVARLLENYNYNVEITSQTRDGGYDLILTKNDIVDQKIMVEVKRTSPNRKVGASSVRALYASLMNLSFDKGMLVTTSYLTSEAREIVKKTNGKIVAIEYEQLKEWINKYAI